MIRPSCHEAVSSEAVRPSLLFALPRPVLYWKTPHVLDLLFSSWPFRSFFLLSFFLCSFFDGLNSVNRKLLNQNFLWLFDVPGKQPTAVNFHQLETPKTSNPVAFHGNFLCFPGTCYPHISKKRHPWIFWKNLSGQGSTCATTNLTSHVWWGGWNGWTLVHIRHILLDPVGVICMPKKSNPKKPSGTNETAGLECKHPMGIQEISWRDTQRLRDVWRFHWIGSSWSTWEWPVMLTDLPTDWSRQDNWHWWASFRSI